MTINQLSLVVSKIKYFFLLFLIWVIFNVALIHFKTSFISFTSFIHSFTFNLFNLINANVLGYSLVSCTGDEHAIEARRVKFSWFLGRPFELVLSVGKPNPLKVRNMWQVFPMILYC